MPEIIPIKELRKTSEISDLCREKQEPIFVTKNGYGDLVVMSIETYDRLIRSKDIDESIYLSESELENGGKLVEARSALSELREKYFE